MEPSDRPSQKQLDRLAERLRPLFHKLAGAQPEQVIQVTLTAREADGAVTLRMNLKLDGEPLPEEQEAKIEQFLTEVWERSV